MMRLEKREDGERGADEGGGQHGDLVTGDRERSDCEPVNRQGVDDVREREGKRKVSDGSGRGGAFGNRRRREGTPDKECLLEREIAALKRELHGARGLAETERQTVRALRRARETDMRQVREEEQRRGEIALQDLHSRFEHEKTLAVAAKAEQLERKFQAEYSRLSHRSEEEVRRVRGEERRGREKL